MVTGQHNLPITKTARSKMLQASAAPRCQRRPMLGWRTTLDGPSLTIWDIHGPLVWHAEANLDRVAEFHRGARESVGQHKGSLLARTVCVRS